VDGTCVFHAASPRLVGKNMMDFRDIHDKPVIRLITDVAKRPGPDAADWVFYLWEEDKPQLDPQWKSAYVRKAVAPDGKVYLVGSGSYDIKVEEVFIEDKVLEAADLIESADLWTRPGRATLSRKLIYARRVRVGGESMIVGSDFFLATPIWMKSGIETGWPSVPPA
jgi:hypothetical protein